MHNAPKSSLYFYSLLIEFSGVKPTERTDGFIELDAFEDIRTALYDVKKSFAAGSSTRSRIVNVVEVTCVCLNQIR